MIQFKELILFIFFVGLVTIVIAQPTTRPTPDNINQTATPQNDSAEVEILFAEVVRGERIGEQEVRTLVGNVRLQQEDAIFRCDSAIMIGNLVNAYGDVIIQQADTVQIFADSLYYDGNIRKSRLMGNVALTDSRSKLFTELLNYDLNTKIGTYNTGAILENEDTRLTSDKGYYYVRTEEAFFRGNVVVVDPEFSLKADTLKIDTETNITYFLGPTDILNKDTSQIYATKGFYDPQKKYAEFDNNPLFKNKTGFARAKKMIYEGDIDRVSLVGDAMFKDESQTARAPIIRYNTENKQVSTEGNTVIKDGDQTITSESSFYDEVNEVAVFIGKVQISDTAQILDADTVRYDRASRIGRAFGNITWRDTVQNLTIIADSLEFNEVTEYVLALGRPMLSTVVENDTLWLSADTLYSIPKLDTINNDTVRFMIANKDVRLFKSNLQAVCDSLTYNTLDSIFEFFKDPIIWSDTSQFTADTVRIRLKQQKIHRIFLLNESFIINSPDEVYFNQVKGKGMIAYFKENNIERMQVLGNGESVYYALDEDKAYIAVNQTICSEMLLYFGNNEVEDIRFYTQPKATLYPMSQVNHNTLRMKGFRWEKDKRPMSKADLR